MTQTQSETGGDDPLFLHSHMCVSIKYTQTIHKVTDNNVTTSETGSDPHIFH